MSLNISAPNSQQANLLRRVVITGYGAVTPLGHSAKETWNNVLAGKSGVGPITLFDAEKCACNIAAEVKDYDVCKTVGPFTPRPLHPERKVTQAVSGKDKKKMGRFIHFAMGAGVEAYEHSGLDKFRDKISPERIGVNIGVGMGGLREIEDTHDAFLAKGFKRISPFFIPSVIPNLCSGQLSILLDLQGPNLCNVTACSSSSHSVGESFHMIKRGDADVMIVGGAESVICVSGVGGFASMKALSTRNDAPEKASRPFDRDRDGFVCGEGAAVMVLEELETAKARGATIYAEVLGYGLSGDAYHMTLPAPAGAGGYRAMEMALKQSGLKNEDIHYINAHGTSTPAGDAEEASAIARLFPNHKSHLHVSSTKSMTGHLLGAAGAIESLFSVQAIHDGIVPPTINLDNLDPKCAKLGLDFTANKPVKKKIDYALSNSFGFGGTNATLVFGKKPD